jgi:predicted transcriptional regulator
MSMTLSIADDVEQQLEELAKSTGQTKSFLVKEAIRVYLQQESWQIAETRLAIQEADAGDFAEAGEVQRLLDKWR